MTDEMTVQAQRPSALPYVLGGAAVGAGAGWGAAAAGYGVPTAKYSSWEDAIADASKDDEFIKKQAEKTNDNAANWKTIKDQRKAVADAEKAVKDINMPEGFEAKAELDAVIDKEIALDNAKKAVTEKEKAEYNKVLEKLKKFEGEKYDFEGKSYNKEELKTLLNSTKDEDKAVVERLVKDHSDYKNAISADGFAQTEKEAVTKAEEALQKANENLTNKDTKGLASGIKENYTKARKGLETAKNKAKEVLTEDLLSKCKKPSTLWTALIGAAVLGIGGYLVRPGAKEETV